MPEETRRHRFHALIRSFENERSSFLTHWRDLSDNILPRRAQFTVTQTNRGERRNLKIIDNTATLASRTLASGMMGGVTSPARPWFRLTTPDPAFAEQGQVKEWLHTVTLRMSSVFLRSNLYKALPILYADMGTFATGAMLVEEDFDDVLRFYTFPIGSYALALNDKLQVDVFFREFRLTVRQVIQRFAKRDENGNIIWTNFSTAVKAEYDRGHFDTWIDIYHIIQPNTDFDPRKLDSKRYESVYFEKGSTSTSVHSPIHEPDIYLRDRGYDNFPVLAPRWETTGEDVYGTNCPGMAALGDIRGLQIMQKKKAQAVSKMVNPPMTGPGSMKNSKSSILPGDITYVDVQTGQQGFQPAHEVRFSVGEIIEDIREHQFRIRRAYYEDLFLMLANIDRREITATEIEERKEEKLLALGPVLEQLNQDLLDPLINITFDMMEKQGLIPEPPESIEGLELKVEYISIMHAAQKLSGLVGVERTAQFVTSLADIKPDVIDKLDGDQMVELYADITGIPPNLIVPDEAVLQIREARAQQAAQEAQAAQVEQTAKTAKELSATDLEGNNALAALLDRSQAGALQ